MNCDVWINGQHLGKQVYGYTNFYYDISPFVRKGENIIAVKVDNSLQPNSRWYSGSGIYSHVWLDVAGPIHIAQWGTYITTPTVDPASATIAVQTTLVNRLSVIKNIKLKSIVVDNSGKEIAFTEIPVSLKPSGKTEVTQTIKITAPVLWSLEKPAQYSLSSQVLEDKKVIDKFISPFGIRKIEFDKDKGFFLKGISKNQK